ncbi:MAG: Holliday junction resolvase RuvX [Alistipes sp.]|jgi:putative Holliday junction resolvase|nr:Holliday junction resolvase RuvX [Alistipes sp.]
MGRILAIDYGTKRTGLAVTDPLRIIAGALETVPTHTLHDWLAAYFAREKVDIVVIGKPTQMNGEPSESMAHIAPFVKKLRAGHPDKQVVYSDERFTSRLAQRAIIDGGVPKMARRDKSLVDKISATIILQDYLESREYKETIL